MPFDWLSVRFAIAKGHIAKGQTRYYHLPDKMTEILVVFGLEVVRRGDGIREY